MFTPKKILVPIDFSVYADNALKQAIGIAKQHKAVIYLLHVIDEGFHKTGVDFSLDEAIMQKIAEERLSRAKEKLEAEVTGINEEHDGIKIVYDVRSGIPYEEIIKEQQEKDIDLVVIASHGKTGIMENMLGSVVAKVLKRVKCQVLLVIN